jgi:nicotinamide-nucleotide amidase
MFNKKNIQELANLLIKEKQKLAVAESVTAGLMQLAFAGAEEASSFFEGGITAYNLLQKWRLLQIDEIHALSCNCVSPRVAVEMAQGVRQLFGTDWGIGITGYAATVPQMGINELFAHVAFVYKENTVLEKTWRASEDELLQVQIYYIDKTVEAFLHCVKNTRVTV